MYGAAGKTPERFFGHTHLAKRIEIPTPGDRPALYLNTGTWADLMRMPDAVIDGSDAQSTAALDAFVADLEKDDVARWRRPVPTFAQIELGDHALVSAALRFADEGASPEVTTEGLLERLRPEPAS